MIILDYSSVAVSNIFAQHANEEMSEPLLRHMILNTVRMYNSKFKSQYGKFYIACDHASWRKQYFSHYKANRKKARDESSMDWTSIFNWMSAIREEISTHLPYNVIHVEGAEADDIIATLVHSTQEFGIHNNEPVMIVSADKDFLQLQQYGNVKQFSSLLKKELKESDPRRYLFEHIVRGDGGDGVPNIFSDDDTFIVEDKRQTPLSKKKLESLYAGYLSGNIVFEKVEHERNFHRNQRMIDLSKIPDDVRNAIMQNITEQENKPKPAANQFMNYLIAKRCNKLLESMSEFF